MKESLSVLLVLFFMGIIFGMHFMLYGFLQSSNSLSVQTVTVAGNSMLSESEVVQLSGIEQGSGIFQYDLKTVAENIQRHPMVESATVHRSPPSTIAIVICEKKPTALVNDGKQSMLCDKDGNILNIGFLGNLPSVFTDYPLFIIDERKISDELIVSILKNLSEFPKSDEIKKIFIKKEEGIYITARGVEETVFYLGKSIPNDELLKRVVLIADRIKEKNLKIKYVDVNKNEAVAYQ